MPLLFVDLLAIAPDAARAMGAGRSCQPV